MKLIWGKNNKDFILKKILYKIFSSNIVEFRKKYAEQFAKRHNMKLGFMSAFVKASACALVDNPVVNAGNYY
jgi:pyruvate/2-oxoglutarate dehydrogenase complex dihydrolipoamide acyltransferase (E2) component